MKTKYGKQVVSSYTKNLDGEEFTAFVVVDGDYYNTHVISEQYRDDELNTLKLQDHKDDMRDAEKIITLDDAQKYYNKCYLASAIMEHFIWGRFYSEFGAASISVTIEAE